MSFNRSFRDGFNASLIALIAIARISQEQREIAWRIFVPSGLDWRIDYEVASGGRGSNYYSAGAMSIDGNAPANGILLWIEPS